MITISDKGAEKVREFLSGQESDVSMAGLRVGVRGGGCSGVWAEPNSHCVDGAKPCEGREELED